MIKQLLISLLLCSTVFATVTGTDTDNIYTGDDGTVAFAFNFGVFATSEVVVDLVTTATGVSVTQTESTHYTVSATNNDYWNGPGGTVTMVTAPASTEKLYIYRAPPLTQEFNLNAKSTFRTVSTTSTEDTLDKLATQIQYLQHQLDTCLKIPINEVGLTVQADNAVDRASKYVAYSDTGALVATTGSSDTTPHGTFGATIAGTSTQAAALAALNRDTLFVVTDTLYGAVGDGSTDDELAIEAAITAAAVNGGYVFFPTTGSAYKFLTAINVPANVILWFSPGATLMGDGSSTLTFNAYTGRGLFDTDVQVFESTMSVTGLRWVRPQWWGALADGSNDDSVPIQAAINAVPVAAGGVPQAELGAGGTIYFSPGTYLCTTGIVNSGRKISFEGSSMDNTTLKKNANIDLLKVDSFVRYQHLKNMTLDGNSKSSSLLYLNGPNYFHIENCSFNDNGGVAATTTDAALYFNRATVTTMTKVFLVHNVRSGYFDQINGAIWNDIHHYGGTRADDMLYLGHSGMVINKYNIEMTPSAGSTFSACRNTIINGINMEIDHSVIPITIGATGNPCKNFSIQNVHSAKVGTGSTLPSILMNNSSSNISIKNFDATETSGTGTHSGGWIEVGEVFGVSLENISAWNMGTVIDAAKLIVTSSVGPDFLSIKNVYGKDAATLATGYLGPLLADNLTISQTNFDITLHPSSTNVVLENCTGTITDTGFVGVNVSNALLTKITQLTNTNIINLAATPIELVPAPGADKVLEFVSAVLVLEYSGNNVFTEAGDNLIIAYDDASAATVSEVIECTGFIDQAADTITRAVPVKDAIVAASAAINKNLALKNNNAEFAGNAAADNLMRVMTTYRIHDSLGL